jgi:predicted small integral membrane protein
VFFFGFITVGGNWFVMYLNSKWNGLDPAFQNTTTTFLTALLVLGVLIFDRFDAFSDRLHAASERLHLNDDK